MPAMQLATLASGGGQQSSLMSSVTFDGTSTYNRLKHAVDMAAFKTLALDYMTWYSTIMESSPQITVEQATKLKFHMPVYIAAEACIKSSEKLLLLMTGKFDIVTSNTHLSLKDLVETTDKANLLKSMFGSIGTTFDWVFNTEAGGNHGFYHNCFTSTVAKIASYETRAALDTVFLREVFNKLLQTLSIKIRSESFALLSTHEKLDQIKSLFTLDYIRDFSADVAAWQQAQVTKM
jgi:hypothetical protein